MPHSPGYAEIVVKEVGEGQTEEYSQYSQVGGEGRRVVKEGDD